MPCDLSILLQPLQSSTQLSLLGSSRVLLQSFVGGCIQHPSHLPVVVLCRLSEGDTGEVSPCRTCVGEPPSNQMGGDNSDRPSQDLQGTDAQGGNPHQAEPPLPQQGWWAGAAWMLDGRLEEGNPATSGDTP